MPGRAASPASLFRLAPEHLASRALLELARSARSVLAELGRLAGALPRPPLSVIVLDPFAHPDAGISTLVVRPAEITEGDQAWGPHSKAGATPSTG